MDSESDELELRRVLKALPDDADAADRWRRYHLARSMMQREQGVDVSVDLSAGIMARLQDEPAPIAFGQEERASSRTHHISFARGAGVAAAVSLMVITGVQFLGSSGSTSQPSGGLATTTQGGSSVNQVQPVSLGAQPASLASSGMPMFEPTPFRLNGQAQSGLMNVSDSGFSSVAIPQSATMQQTNTIDVDQIRLLQSYLEQHSKGAAYGNGDSWMPLMRSSSVTEPLGQR